MKLLAGVVLASIFFGIFVGLEVKSDRGRELAEFGADVDEIVTILESLESQSPGARDLEEVTVPEGCGLSFEGGNLVAAVDGRTVQSVGVELDGAKLGPGSYSLIFERTEEGVRVYSG